MSIFVYNVHQVTSDELQDMLNRATYDVVSVAPDTSSGVPHAYIIVQRALIATQVIGGGHDPQTAIGPNPYDLSHWFLPDLTHIAHLGSR